VREVKVKYVKWRCADDGKNNGDDEIKGASERKIGR
jgi:hypothetical protein